MTDFQVFNATSHPIVELINDYNNLLHHGLEKTATYIIRKNGSYYESIKGGTSTDAGTIAYGGADSAGGASGTSMQAVLQATINACTSGGKIHISAGTYTITSGVSITDLTDDITITGEGRGNTILDFSTAPTGDLFTLGNGTDRVYRVEISNMSMKGFNNASTPQRAIFMNYVVRCRFINLNIYYFHGAGKYAMHGTKMADTLLFDCHFYNNNANLIIDGTVTNTSNKIMYNYFFLPAAYTTNHINIGTGSTLNRIIGNLFEGSLDRVVIATNSNTFMGNVFEANAGATDLTISGAHHNVVGNVFSNTVDFTATTSTILGNTGWITHKTGAAVAIGDDGTFAHGLSEEPTSIQLTCADVDVLPSIKTKDAVNVTVNLWDCSAEIPLAGTTTVYWECRCEYT